VPLLAFDGRVCKLEYLGGVVLIDIAKRTVNSFKVKVNTEELDNVVRFEIPEWDVTGVVDEYSLKLYRFGKLTSELKVRDGES